MHILEKNPEETVIKEIQRFVSESPDNRNPELDGTPNFSTPLIGFADVCDPLFLEFKECESRILLMLKHLVQIEEL